MGCGREGGLFRDHGAVKSGMIAWLIALTDREYADAKQECVAEKEPIETKRKGCAADRGFCLILHHSPSGVHA